MDVVKAYTESRSVRFALITSVAEMRNKGMEHCKVATESYCVSLAIMGDICSVLEVGNEWSLLSVTDSYVPTTNRNTVAGLYTEITIPI